MGQLESILEDSAASMRSEEERVTKVQKAAWWRKRLALNERLKSILLQMQAALGPWL